MPPSKEAIGCKGILKKKEARSGRSGPFGTAAAPQPKQIELKWAEEPSPTQPHPDPDEDVGPGSPASWRRALRLAPEWGGQPPGPSPKGRGRTSARAKIGIARAQPRMPLTARLWRTEARSAMTWIKIPADPHQLLGRRGLAPPPPPSAQYRAMRIVSLLPSATEIVCALGLRDRLVGISHDCDWPPDLAREKAILTQAAVHEGMSSAEIDETVKAFTHRGLSVYRLDLEKLRELRPDLILTQELCGVCAPSSAEVREAVKILNTEPRILSLEPTRLEEILETIRAVGEATNTQERAEELIQELRARIDRVRSRTEARERRPRTLALEWLEPLYVGGHWVPELIELAGGEPPNPPGEPSYEIDWEAVEVFDPEVIVLMPCGFSPERALSELDLLFEYEDWEELRAVKDGEVYLVHGSYYFNRPGPRIVVGLEILAKILHPDLFEDVAIPEDAVIRVDEPLIDRIGQEREISP